MQDNELFKGNIVVKLSSYEVIELWGMS